jgi:hypothetical protein
VDALVDWNEIMRRINKRYDLLVGALSEKDIAKRAAGIAAFEADLKEDFSDVKSVPSAARLLLQPGAVATDKLEKTLTSLLMPAIGAVSVAEYRCVATGAEAKIAFALGVYRTKHGRYPKLLADLVPDNLPELPSDPFTGESFYYETKEQHAVIYSLGPNRQDEHGERNGQGADDVPLYLPGEVE